MPFPSEPRLPAKFSSPQLRRSAILGIALLVAAAAHAQTPTPKYNVTPLGSLPGGDAVVGYAINESGDVAGYGHDSSGYPHAVLVKNGQVIDLGVFPGANAIVAYGINGYDQVTGQLDYPVSSAHGFFSHVFLYSAGKIQDIGAPPLTGVPPTDEFAAGLSINDSGEIAVGAEAEPIFAGFPPPNVFLYSGGEFTATPLQVSVSPFDSSAYDPFAFGESHIINASGQIAGSVNGDQQAAIFNSSSGTTTVLASAPSQASSLNDLGQSTGGLGDCAPLYSYGNYNCVVNPDDNPDYAYNFGTGINAAAQIVGITNEGPSATGYPFLYKPGQGVVTVPWPQTLATHLAINDKGQIVEDNYLISPVFTQFSTLNALVDLIGKPANTFAAGGRFTLGAKSSGINPLTETTVLQLGGYHISIPPSSFTETNGVYSYKGKIGNVNLQAVIRPVAANVFLFGVVGQGAVGLPPSYPLNLVLTIGTDTGSQQIDTNYNAGGLTAAEACKIFGLTCS